MKVETFDSRQCLLGEGPLWHPLRQQLFWFDILGRCLRSETGGQLQEWTFAEHVSAAGWIDRDRLLIASEMRLMMFDVETRQSTHCVALESETPATRSNDGCADPHGGFWISTMGKAAEAGLGAIYRYFDGQVKRLFSDLTIPNAICFAKDGRTAYFTDSPSRKILAQDLDQTGWPVGQPRILIDLSSQKGLPDGATVDATGHLWVAMWGSASVLRISPDGIAGERVSYPASQVTCPAFGGADMRTLFVTSASEGTKKRDMTDGQVFAAPASVSGLADPRVRAAGF